MEGESQEYKVVAINDREQREDLNQRGIRVCNVGKHVEDTCGTCAARMQLVVAIFVSKETSCGFHSIGLLDLIWKVLEKILDRRLANLECCDFLHGLLANRGTGTAISQTHTTTSICGAGADVWGLP